MLSKDALYKKVLILLGLILVDQGTKYIFLKYSSFASINPDLAFSVKFINPLLLNVLVLAGFAGVMFVYYRKKFFGLSVTLIISGAFSNIVDRVIRQGVVDFIDFKIWPSFNLADIFILVGSLLLIIDLMRKR
jgi:signal peptidase II